MSKKRLPALEYCYVCGRVLALTSGRVLLRPLKETAERSTIPLADRRVTMCQDHADAAIASGDYALVEAAASRLTS